MTKCISASIKVIAFQQELIEKFNKIWLPYKEKIICIPPSPTILIHQNNGDHNLSPICINIRKFLNIPEKSYLFLLICSLRFIIR